MKLRARKVEEPHPNKMERYKLLYDYLKHLTTLSSGSILVILALAENFFKDSPLSPWLFRSLISFLVAILFALLAMIVLAGNIDSKRTSDNAANVFAAGFTFSGVAFLAGMLFVVTAIAGQYG
jgi:hypothetical protein